MNKIRVIFAVVAVWTCGGLSAQSFETGATAAVEYDYRILKGWHVSAEGELRFDHNFTHYDRMKLEAQTSYTCWGKRLKIGMAYNFLNYHDREQQLFDNRHRIKGFVTLAPKFGDWKLAYRAMVQSTFRDERRGSYKFNPKTYMRNRLQVTWSVPRQPLKLYVAEEFWWRLYKPGDNIIDQLRTTAGVEYSFDKRQALDLHLRFDQEVQVRHPEMFLSIGVGYSFSSR